MTVFPAKIEARHRGRNDIAHATSHRPSGTSKPVGSGRENVAVLEHCRNAPKTPAIFAAMCQQVSDRSYSASEVAMTPRRYGPLAYVPITRRPQLTWPDSARVALWVNPNMEFSDSTT
jgi:hypothetical protein